MKILSILLIAVSLFGCSVEDNLDPLTNTAGACRAGSIASMNVHVNLMFTTYEFTCQWRIE